jgi:hypothetical protein
MTRAAVEEVPGTPEAEAALSRRTGEGGYGAVPKWPVPKWPKWPETGKGEHRDYVRSALKTGQAQQGRWRMVQDQRYKLIEGFFEERTLFDREADLLETENIAANKPAEVARLEKLFAAG